MLDLEHGMFHSQTFALCLINSYLSSGAHPLCTILSMHLSQTLSTSQVQLHATMNACQARSHSEVFVWVGERRLGPQHILVYILSLF